MASDIQVTIDCADPNALAAFWAEALGYQVEDNSKQVEEGLGAGYLQEAMTVEVDGRLAFKFIATCVDPEGKRPRLLFQQVPEPKTVKNRVHLDVHAEDEGLEAAVARFERLGAKKLYEIDEAWGHWVTLQDPEGNEFCVG